MGLYFVSTDISVPKRGKVVNSDTSQPLEYKRMLFSRATEELESLPVVFIYPDEAKDNELILVASHEYLHKGT